MRKTILAACTALAVCHCGASWANAANSSASGPRYDWLEIAYGFDYMSFLNEPEYRERSDLGWRASTNLKLTDHFFLAGSYDASHYDEADDQSGMPIHTEENITQELYGLGTHVPLAAALDGTLQIGYARLGFDGLIEGGGARGELTFDQVGPAYQAGVRSLIAAGAEAVLSYQYAPLRGDVNSTIHGKTRLETLAVGFHAPLAGRLGFSLRYEASWMKHDYWTDTGGNLGAKDHLEQILIGLRYAL